MKLKKVEVLWSDTTSKGGWYYARDIEEMKIIVITTIGYLFSKDKEKVVIVSSIDGQSGKAEYAGPHLIPTCCVKEIRKI